MSRIYTQKNNGHILHLWMLTIIFFITIAHPLSAQEIEASTLEAKMIQYGLVDIQTVAPSIKVDLKYSSKDNFMKEDMYGPLKKAYLLPHLAVKLREANTILSRQSQDSLCLIIYDAARPQSVQRKMYALVQGTPMKVYVAHPHKGGRHNFGAAVDLSIWNKKTQKALDMGTDFDYFGEASHMDKDSYLLKKGLITQRQLENRQLLRQIMSQVQLRPYRREWWHYEEEMSIGEVRRKFKLLNF